MLIRRSVVRASRLRGDDGIALPTVLLSMLVLTAFALAALAFVVQSTPSNRTTADAKAALAAAQAGVDDYTSRLNSRPTYYTAVDATNKAFTQRANGAPFTDGRDPRGTTVPGATDSFYRYQVLTQPTTTARGGLIRVRVTGTASGQSRSLTASYGQEGYLKFLYFTDVEAIDPLLLANNQSAANRDAYLHHCSQHWYDENGETGRWSDEFTYQGKAFRLGCTNIQFAADDVITGPLHTNDAILLGGAATFVNPKVETSWPKAGNPSWPGGKPWRGGFTPRGTAPYYKEPLPPLRSNIKLREKSEDQDEGCLYSGATSIELKGTSMEVWSPGTTSTTSPDCLDVSRRAQKQTITTIPPVIYVRPSTACGSVELPYGAADRGSEIGGTTTTYDCKAGNAFVSGTLNGQTTVAAENDVVITGDLKYAGGASGDDVLGLIPNNYVWVYHPVEAGGSFGKDVGGKRVMRIDAAILSLNRSFLVQNWDKGGNESPTLTVNGVIAQKFRGPVGSTYSNGAKTGYTKAYVYDERLKNLPPPYFLTPEDAPWTVQRITDG